MSSVSLTRFFLLLFLRYSMPAAVEFHRVVIILHGFSGEREYRHKKNTGKNNRTTQVFLNIIIKMNIQFIIDSKRVIDNTAGYTGVLPQKYIIIRSLCQLDSDRRESPTSGWTVVLIKIHDFMMSLSLWKFKCENRHHRGSWRRYDNKRVGDSV